MPIPPPTPLEIPLNKSTAWLSSFISNKLVVSELDESIERDVFIVLMNLTAAADVDDADADEDEDEDEVDDDELHV